MGNDTYESLLTKDKTGNDTGHLALFLIPDSVGRRLVARLQDGSTTVYRCSAPVSSDEWHHVALSLSNTGSSPSPIELFLDGESANELDITFKGLNFTVVCGSAADFPKGTKLEGNLLPWIWGASASESGDGADFITHHFDGELDHLRIRSSETTEQQVREIAESFGFLSGQ